MENINLFDEENSSLNEPPENSPAKGEKRKGKIKWPIFLNGSSLLIIYALFIVLPILIRGMNLVIINPGKVGIAYNKRGKTEFRCVTYPDPLSPIFSFIRCSAQPTKKRFFFDIKHKRNTERPTLTKIIFKAIITLFSGVLKSKNTVSRVSEKFVSQLLQ